ncbi:MAG: alpha-L-fucosidase [Bryobacteraceae bacterium]|nr:alpha-L-fucosidase [Bryobacteraceae bacterium]MDW8378354.1 alpha-L-fucosidase [Bryobacterales bacterium]
MLSALNLALALLTMSLPAQQRYAPTWQSLDQRPTPSWFRDAKFGIFIHWGVYSVPSYAPPQAKGGDAYAEWYWNHLRRGPTHKGAPNLTWLFHKRVYGEDFDYSQFAPRFQAELYDPDQWAEVFRASGARYVVLTSKHHDGFALWPSAHASKTWRRPWNAAEVGPKRDLLGDLSRAVRAKGLKMGYYYSLYEWYNPLWLEDRKRYASEHMRPQFQDLVTRYHPALIFADGEWDMPSADWGSPELLAWLFNESPVKDDVVINDRWGKDTRHKHGGYYTTEYTAGLDATDHPWEESRGMGRSYGYNRMERFADYRTERELILMLVDLVSRGGNLLLDIGPTGDGRIPVIMEERLLQLGAWLERNGEAVYSTRPWTRTRQWSPGQPPRLETGEFNTRYEVTELVEAKRPGQAILEAFFTSRGETVYAILPGWPGPRFTLRAVTAPPGMKITLLGFSQPLRWKSSGADLVVEMPPPPGSAAHAQHAYVLRLPGLKAR